MSFKIALGASKKVDISCPRSQMNRLNYVFPWDWASSKHTTVNPPLPPTLKGQRRGIHFLYFTHHDTFKELEFYWCEQQAHNEGWRRVGGNVRTFWVHTGQRRDTTLLFTNVLRHHIEQQGLSRYAWFSVYVFIFFYLNLLTRSVSLVSTRVRDRKWENPLNCCVEFVTLRCALYYSLCFVFHDQW